MADPADLGNDRAALQLDAALARQADKLAPESHPDFDGEHCVSCGGEVHPLRLAMKRIRCVGCQGELEAKRARGLA